MEETPKEPRKITIPSSELPCCWLQLPGSAISEYRYDKDLKSLDVKYAHSGNVFRYLQVPPEVVDDFRLDRLKSAFVMARLEPHFECIQLEPSEIIGEVA